MTKKREQMFKIASEAGLNPIVPEGGYFMIMDLSTLGKNILFSEFFIRYILDRVEPSCSNAEEKLTLFFLVFK